MKFIDFSKKLMPLMHSFFSWFHNEKDSEQVRKYLLKYICTYPLRAACSIVVEHPGSRFIEEYIMPQLLLQWVLNDEDFDGIRYESCSPSDEVKSFGGHNIVLVTKNAADETLDEYLARVGIPKSWKYPIGVSDIVDADEWLSKNDINIGKESNSWHEQIDTYIDDLDGEDVLVSVDYHI